MDEFDQLIAAWAEMIPGNSIACMALVNEFAEDPHPILPAMRFYLQFIIIDGMGCISKRERELRLS